MGCLTVVMSFLSILIRVIYRNIYKLASEHIVVYKLHRFQDMVYLCVVESCLQPQSDT